MRTGPQDPDGEEIIDTGLDDMMIDANINIGTVFKLFDLNGRWVYLPDSGGRSGEPWLIWIWIKVNGRPQVNTTGKSDYERIKQNLGARNTDAQACFQSSGLPGHPHPPDWAVCGARTFWKQRKVCRRWDSKIFGRFPANIFIRQAARTYFTIQVFIESS